MSTPALRSLFARLALTPSMSSRPVLPAISQTTNSDATSASSVSQTRSFHATTADYAKGKKKKGPRRDYRVMNLKRSMPRVVPAPLRFARNRWLRHWTIHRAWLLYQRQERERREHELQRMYQSMHAACEELRTTSGPGTREEGYLYRVAMEKKGMYGHGAMPMDYARAQTETPARQAWNHEWTR
ncbi:hypothetical protein GGS20DRAFT_359265 [Poronia punctata]|nr:hypothetical protein GGS20DRAFT_359265 [Poronia punctata]